MAGSARYTALLDANTLYPAPLRVPFLFAEGVRYALCMTKNLLLIASAALLTGCAGSPFYERQTWAQEPFAKASKDCRMEVLNPVGPLSYDLCMRGKGWHGTNKCERGYQCQPAT